MVEKGNVVRIKETGELCLVTCTYYWGLFSLIGLEDRANLRWFKEDDIELEVVKEVEI